MGLELIGEEVQPLSVVLMELRSSRRLSQKQMAEKAGLNHSTVNRIERRERRPELKTLYAIMDALDVTERLTDGERQRLQDSYAEEQKVQTYEELARSERDMLRATVVQVRKELGQVWEEVSRLEQKLEQSEKDRLADSDHVAQQLETLVTFFSGGRRYNAPPITPRRKKVEKDNL